MSYYKNMARAYNWIDQRAKAAKENEVRLDAKALAYEATKIFPVGEKKLLERMEKMIQYENAPIDL